MEVASIYQAGGTPTGYMINEQGNIASSLAMGAQALLALLNAPSSDPALAGVPSAIGANQNGHEESGNGNGHRVYKGNRTLADSHINRNGLTAGTPAPSFRLPRLNGEELSLEEYRGQRVLLVFSDPNCGPCNHLAPQLEQLHRQRPDVQVLMVSRGDAEANRQKVTEHGLTFPVVLQRQWEISRLYAMFATPVAYLINEEGIIAADVAMGEEAILALSSGAATKTNGKAEALQRGKRKKRGKRMKSLRQEGSAGSSEPHSLLSEALQ